MVTFSRMKKLAGLRESFEDDVEFDVDGLKTLEKEYRVFFYVDQRGVSRREDEKIVAAPNAIEAAISYIENRYGRSRFIEDWEFFNGEEIGDFELFVKELIEADLEYFAGNYETLGLDTDKEKVVLYFMCIPETADLVVMEPKQSNT